MDPQDRPDAPPPPAPAASLTDWMEWERHVAVSTLLRCVSATSLVKTRPAFGQTIMPKKGSVLGALQIAAYDPDPDYFFHWLRDSSLVMDAVRLLASEGAPGVDAAALFRDFVRFSLEVSRLSGAKLVSQGDFRRAVDPQFLQFVRSDEELGRIEGDLVLGDVRFNPDATLDITRWSRPQHDGPALRALTVLRARRLDPGPDAGTRTAMDDLLRLDLDFTYRRWREPCIDIWEEESAHHYYTRLVQSAALEGGAAFMDECGENRRALDYRAAAGEIRDALDRHWSPEESFYVSRVGGPASSPSKALDIAVILAVLHAGLASGAHSILDPKVQATLSRLEDLFASEYPINRDLEAQFGPAMGRYQGDTYYSGGAYYFSTLAAAELYYRLAAALSAGAGLEVTQESRAFLRRVLGDERGSGAEELPGAPEGRRSIAAALLGKGDGFMATVRRYTPASGELSEQFDQSTGLQTSGKNIAWCYAAFITAFAARKAAYGAHGS